MQLTQYEVDMTGTIISEPVNLANVEAGTVAMLKTPDGIIAIVTVQHINAKGQWHLMGDKYTGPLLDDMSLCRAMVVGEGGMFPLKFNQWKNAIKSGEIDTGKQVTYRLQPAKFVKGHYMNECIICNAHFMGHKRQSVCSNCCEENATAQIVLTKSKPKPATKAKRKRIMTPAKAKMIALEAFKKGLKGDSYQSVENWLDKQL